MGHEMTEQKPITDAIGKHDPNNDDKMQWLTHGPKFRMLSKEHQGWISKIHHNLGHPNVQKLQNVLKQQGYSDEIVQGIADFCCNACHETQAARIARPATLSDVRDFNDCVGCDLVTWTSKSDKNHQFLHVADSARNFQLAMPVLRTDADSLFESLKHSKHLGSMGWTM